MPRGPVWDGRHGGWRWVREDEMSGPQFFETRMGHRFYEGDVPKIAAALERIARALEQLAMTPEERGRQQAKEGTDAEK